MDKETPQSQIPEVRGETSQVKQPPEYFKRPNPTTSKNK